MLFQRIGDYREEDCYYKETFDTAEGGHYCGRDQKKLSVAVNHEMFYKS